jgi:predicted transporter
MNKWMEILLGLLFLNGAIFVWAMNFWNFGDAALSFFKGGLIWLVLLVGTIFVMLGISDLKE